MFLQTRFYTTDIDVKALQSMRASTTSAKPGLEHQHRNPSLDTHSTDDNEREGGDEDKDRPPDKERERETSKRFSMPAVAFAKEKDKRDKEQAERERGAQTDRSHRRESKNSISVSPAKNIEGRESKSGWGEGGSPGKGGDKRESDKSKKEKFVIKVTYWDTTGLEELMDKTCRICAGVTGVVYMFDGECVCM